MKLTPVYFQHNILASLQKDDKRRFKYIVHKGSSRSSKTTSIIQWINNYCESNPNTRATVWRDTRTSLGSTVWSDFRKLFGHKHRFGKQTSPIFYANGSTFEPHGADFTNAHGLTQNIAWLNEPYKIPKDTFDAIDQRADLIIIDYNPIGSHWVDDLMKHERAVVIHSTYKDNPFCPEEQRIKIESYKPTPENIEAGTADEYKWQVYGLGLKAEKPNKIYKNWQFKDFTVDALPFYGLDFGQSAPTAIVKAQFDKALFVEELFYNPVQDEGTYPSLLERLKIPKSAVIVCDSAKPVIIADIRRSGWTRAIGANKKQGSVVQGISLLQSIPVIAKGVNLQTEYESYEWAVDRYGLPLDQPIKQKDHLMDALRYVFFEMKYYLKL